MTAAFIQFSITGFILAADRIHLLDDFSLIARTFNICQEKYGDRIACEVVDMRGA